jgi:hypothetical protein
VGCVSVLNLNEAGSFEQGPSGFTDPYPDAALLAMPGLEEAGAPPGCATDLDNDPQNCGRCGRACSGTCRAGRCDVVTLVGNLPSPPTKLVIGSGRGFVELSDMPVVSFFVGAVSTTCALYRVRAFALGAPGALVDVAVGCRNPGYTYDNSPRWGIDGERVYVWSTPRSSLDPYEYKATLNRFDGKALADGGVALDGGFDAGGETLVTGVAVHTPIVPDPANPGGILLADPSANKYGVSTLLTDGGFVSQLHVTYAPDTYTSELVASFDATDAGFGVVTNSAWTSAQQRVFAAPRPCDASTCATASTSAFPSLCGVRRFGDVLRWCAAAPDPSGNGYDLLLVEMSATTGAIRLLNSAPVITRGANGQPILPLLYLDELGIFFVRSVRIDLLGASGAPVPVANAASKPLLLASDAKTLYWAESDAIYGVAK